MKQDALYALLQFGNVRLAQQHLQSGVVLVLACELQQRFKWAPIEKRQLKTHLETFTVEKRGGHASALPFYIDMLAFTCTCDMHLLFLLGHRPTLYFPSSQS